MTAPLLIFGVLLVGLSAWLIARLVALPRLRVESHLRSVESYGFASAETQIDTPEGLLYGSLAPRAEAFGTLLLEKVPRLPPLSRAQLSGAGIYKLSVESVHGYRGAAAIGLPSAMLLLVMAGGGVSPLILALLLCLAGLAWQGPAILITRRGRKRLDRVDRSLPQVIDLLVVTVEAGTGFAAALSTVANRYKGPLGDELRLTLQQQSLGVSTERALLDLAERCDTSHMRAFVRTVIRAEAHGISIGPVMRHLATDIRQRRRDAAREKIQKAPIKMLIPLLIFILLPLMAVVFFPAAWNLLHILGGTS